MKRLEVFFAPAPEDSQLVGVLAEERGRVFFEYASPWLRRGLNLSPVRLPLRAGLHEHRDRAFGPLPGLFDDSLPDGWGLLLMDRHFRKRGVDPRSLGPLDRLAWVGDRAMGALKYRPASEAPEDGARFELHALAREADEILAGKADDVLPQLARAGGSAGGARPKVLVGYNEATGEVISGAQELPEGFEHWIVKFSAKQDIPDAGAMEYAYSLMAKAAGIEMPATRLFVTSAGDRFFGVKRFDRIGNRRMHVHTFGNMIQSNFRVPSCDYGDLVKTTALVTRDAADVQRVFTRMAFNVMAHNRDDHVKNFAFVMDSDTGAWRLSPAYDLVFSAGPGGEHTMSVAGEGKNPRRADLFRAVQKAELSAKTLDEMVTQVAEATGRWSEFAERAGVSAETAEKIAGHMRLVVMTMY